MYIKRKEIHKSRLFCYKADLAAVLHFGFLSQFLLLSTNEIFHLTFLTLVFLFHNTWKSMVPSRP